ncbi:mCG141250 [Mus musculus]|nr:mCG141250 [Mus musculus]
MVLPGSPMDQKIPFFPFARLANGVLSLLHSWVHRTPEDAPPRRRRISSKAGGKKTKKQKPNQLAFRRELPCSCGEKREKRTW